MFTEMSLGPKDPFKCAVGQRLKLLQTALGMRPVDFARHWGISQQAVYNYSIGDQAPSVNYALRLCEKTGATLDWIYKGDESGLPVALYKKIGAAKLKQAPQKKK